MKKYLFNPFIYLAGGKALLIGFVAMTLTLVIASYSNTHFDGAIDAHIGLNTSFSVYVLEQFIAWGSLVLVFNVMAMILSKSNFRFIDIAGTLALSRTPMLLIALIGFVPALQNINITKPEPAMIVLSLVLLIPLIWAIALMYNAFSISVNLKGTTAIVGFVVGLLLSEILSKVLIHFAYKSLSII